MSDLLSSLCTAIPDQSSAIESLWLSLWVHPEGIGLEQIFRNLRLSISERMNEQDQDAENETPGQLQGWAKAIDSVLAHMEANPECIPKHVFINSHASRKHPIAGYGLTSHGVYAGCWNLHEFFADAKKKDSEFYCKALRKIQLQCVEIQAELIALTRINISSYMVATNYDATENSVKKSHIDFIEKKCKVSTHKLGFFLRKLSKKENSKLILELHSSYNNGSWNVRQVLRRLVRPYASPEKVFYDNHVKILEELLSVLVSFGNFKSRRSKRKRPIDRDSDSGEPRKIEHGHTAQWPDYIRGMEKPADLPEFDGWVEPGEVIYEEDESLEDIEEEIDGTGLVTIDPNKIKGSLAKARTQQHYMEMVHQYYQWDNANLTEAESIFLANKLKFLIKHPVEQISTPEWKWASMNLISWLFGVDLESASEIQWGNPSTVLSSGLALISKEKTVEWKVTLRVSPSDSEDFTGGLQRVAELRVPDHTGLGLVLVRRAQNEGYPEGASIFGPVSTQEVRIQNAKSVLKSWSLEYSQRDRIIPGRLERALLVQLMNMVRDRTIAWALAGKESSARLTRMFYAVHTETELSDWLQTAQMALVNQSWHKEVAGPVQSLVFDSHLVTSKYAGARFFPVRKKLLELLVKSRLSAQRHVPPDFLVPNYSLESDMHLVDEGADYSIDGGSTNTDGRKDVAHSKPGSRKSTKDWNDPAAWCAWHDEVVFWTWLVQVLQSSVRPQHIPDILYLQWLNGTDQDWVSLEDKRSKDRDEARACLITSSLNEAYLTITAAQEAFHFRWSPIDATAQQLPFGFEVFLGQQIPQALTPKVAQQWIEKSIGEKWPTNFTRALMRRALYERGLSSDSLDSFMGHGAIAGRVHDQHSLFNPMSHRNDLEDALNEFAKSYGITRLYHRIHLSGDDERIKSHRQLAASKIENRKFESKVKNKSQNSNEFTRWCDSVRSLTDDDMAHLKSLESWYLNLLTNADDPYIRRFIDLKKESGNQINYSVAAAQTAQGNLLMPLRKGLMKNSTAGHGLNLCYRISKALDPVCPTMHVALKAAARVSPYTRERMQSANEARSQLVELQRMLSNSKDRNVALYGLSFYLNTKLSEARNIENAKQDEIEVLPVSLLKNSVANAYSYRLKDSNGRIRQLRGYIDALFSLSPSAIRLISNDNPVESYQFFRNQLKGNFDLPLKMSTWTNTIKWMLFLHLPPLLVAHAAGLLGDQSSTGSAFDNNLRFLSRSIGEDPSSPRDEFDVRPNLTQPLSVLQSQAKEPFFWLDEADRAAGLVALWLDAYLVSNLGIPSESIYAMNYSIAELDRVLYEALFDVPTGHRLLAQNIILVQRKKYGIHAENSDYPDRIDCEVIDWDSFEKLLSVLEPQCIVGRNVARTKRLRMLLILAFRLGMRRREILGLRRVDVELGSRGCIHVRAWFDRELKTMFSSRSLPIYSLLPEREKKWLEELCEILKPGDLLFPQHEHDTMSRAAIKLLRSTLGNNDLKIHHLRHSFASLLLIKLVVARNPSWKAAFQNWNSLQKELSTAHELIGTVVKPWDASGDLLAIARLLGHSSYQVTLLNYLHTLDVALALCQAYVLRELVVPARLQGLVHKCRFGTVRDKLSSLSEDTYFDPESVDPRNSGIQFLHKNPPLKNELKKSIQIQQWLLKTYQQEIVDHKSEEALQGFGITSKDIISWFEPLKARKLVDQLTKLSDVMSDLEMNRLVELGLKYWQPSTPMFWLSAGRSANDPKRTTQIVEDGKELVSLLLLAIPPESIIFSMYSSANSETHARLWAPVMSLVDRSRIDWTKSSSSTAIAAFGVSIAIEKIRCPLVTGIWLSACKGILSVNAIQSDGVDECQFDQSLAE